jgi:uncharacterized membrane protein YdbT with pleckstrin-like domain
MFRFKYLPHREPNEKIIFFLRRHPYVIVKTLFIYFVLGFLPWLAYFYIKNEWLHLTDGQIGLVFLRLLIITFYLFWWLLLYYSWLDYFLDIWIVTNHRVLNIEQKGMFNRIMAEHKLFRIQDVMSEQKGILPTFFDYGEIHIQTAGSEKLVIFEQVPHPHRVARETIKLIENHKKIMAKEIDKIDKTEGIA